MITRRSILRVPVAWALVRNDEHLGSRAASDILPGAIRWDAWYQEGAALSVPRQAQNSLGPVQFQSRAPWYSTVISGSEIVSVGTQADMDIEIQLAFQAGIKYWAYGWNITVPNGPRGDPSMRIAYGRYQASPFKSLVKFCAIASPGNFGCYTPWESNNWRDSVDGWLTYLSMANYQTVPPDRPLIYLFWYSGEIGTYFGGKIANLATAVSYLRSQCARAGIGNPYIVVLNNAASAASEMSSIGADAISTYIAAHRYSALADSYGALAAQAVAYWDRLRATGNPIVPICMTGWDVSPLEYTPQAFYPIKPAPGVLHRFTPGTPTEIAAHLRSAIGYIRSNPRACPSKTMLIYSWNECAEGGSTLCPTLGDPPTNAEAGQPLPTSNLLKAIGPIWTQ